MARKPCIEEKKMKQLWTPWRIEYILGPKPDSCVFCLPESRDEDEERLVLYRGRHAFVIMNKFPYSNGHIMVCPYRHVMALAQLETDETHEIMDLMQRCTLVLQEHFHCEGINIGLNQGQAAGAGIREHLHFHLVPKYKDGFEWGGVFAMNPAEKHLTDAEYAALIEMIKANL